MSGRDGVINVQMYRAFFEKWFSPKISWTEKTENTIAVGTKKDERVNLLGERGLGFIILCAFPDHHRHLRIPIFFFPFLSVLILFILKVCTFFFSFPSISFTISYDFYEVCGVGRSGHSEKVKPDRTGHTRTIHIYMRLLPINNWHSCVFYFSFCLKSYLCVIMKNGDVRGDVLLTPMLMFSMSFLYKVWTQRNKNVLFGFEKFFPQSGLDTVMKSAQCYRACIILICT